MNKNVSKPIIYDKSVVVSGDGDFKCLYEYLIQKNKLMQIIIPNEKSASSLLKPFYNYKTFLIFDKEKLELKYSPTLKKLRMDKIKNGGCRS